MHPNDIQIGMRVHTMPDDRIALVVGRPEPYTGKAKLVRVKYENSTRYELRLNHQLHALPTEQQYPAFGGTHTRGEL